MSIHVYATANIFILCHLSKRVGHFVPVVGVCTLLGEITDVFNCVLAPPKRTKNWKCMGEID